LRSRFPFTRISFRSQIAVIGTTAALLLCAVIFAIFAASQYTKSAVLSGEQRHLTETTSNLVREYNHEATTASLTHEPDPLDASSHDSLAAVTTAALQGTDGVEGGFYSANEDRIKGHASSARSNLAAESPVVSASGGSWEAILDVAKSAVATHGLSQRIVTGDRDTILIEALPIARGGIYLGSAWTAMRLATIPGTNRFRTYLIAAGLGIAAFICVVLTLLVVRGLQSGVRKIEDGLERLEQNLSSEIPMEADPAEIRQIAAAINRLGAALKEKMETEKQMEDRLRHAERLAALGRLVAGVAHEVRNPLATIRLRVQMCERASAPIDVRESCAVALQEIERLNGMVNRLLSFSRPIHLRAEPTNIGRLAEQRLGNFSDLARERGIRLIAKFNPEAKPVSVDQSRMAQVFDNIIQNAIDAMWATGGTLCLNITRESLSKESSEMCIEFNDTGGGIRADIVGRVFDPFFTTKESGTGLGLSVCHELVQAHGGEITVTSAEGCGTTVRVVLPVVAERFPVQTIGAREDR
jgi:signal transduction histidine kinase